MFTTKNRVLCSFLHFLTLFNLFSLISSQEDDYQYKLCSEKNGYYVRNGTYEKNLDKILLSLAPNTNESGYYASSVGNSSDKVIAMVLCRGDVTDTETCRGCIARVANRLKNECYAIKEALGGSNRCLLFYTNNSLSGIVGTPTDYMINPYQNVSNVDRFNTGLMTLLNNLQGKAASRGNLSKYAAGKYPMEGFLTVYAVVQCTPVLSMKQCNDCLVGAIGEIYGCCNNRAGGRVVKPSCNLRYEISPFVKMDQNTTASSPPGSLPVSPGKKNKKTKIVVIVLVTTISLIAIVIFSIIISKRKKSRKQTSVLQNLHFEEVRTTDDLSFEKSLQYDLATISAATDKFSDANKLGQGGFGSVYKGILPNGQEIAVKRLCLSSGQGESEFKNEVFLVAKLQHRNLVRLLGFCIEGVERILIYEFISNTSLDQFLFDPVKRASLDWKTRYRIIEGTARGLLYLHEDSRVRIIHRDLKASNILLDKNMNPKISDFGMARLFDFDETQGSTNTIAGTYGYMAPEYAMHGNFSVKSDVYSFGVLLLEIVSGEKNNSFRQGDEVVEQDLLSYAWKHWQEGRAIDFVDPVLRERDAGFIRDITKCVQIGLLCVQESASVRPTMASVVVMLNSFSATLLVPSQPAFYMSGRMNPEMSPWSSSTADSTNANVKSTGMSDNELSVSELSPR